MTCNWNRLHGKFKKNTIGTSDKAQELCYNQAQLLTPGLGSTFEENTNLLFVASEGRQGHCSLGFTLGLDGRRAVLHGNRQARELEMLTKT
jgi:hypothetical protein